MKIGDLKQKAQMKLQEDQEELQKAVQANLQEFEDNLKQSIKNVAITIESDIINLKEKTKILNFSTTKIYIINFSFCMIIILTVAIAAWALLASTSQKIVILQEDISNLMIQKKEAQTVLAQLKTFGITLQADTEGQFIILPKTTKAETGWTVGEQEAIKIIKVK